MNGRFAGGLLAMLLASGAAQAAAVDLRSPDGRVTARFEMVPGRGVSYALRYAGETVIAPSPAGLLFTTGPDAAPAPAAGLRLLGSEHREGRDRYRPAHGKVAAVDHGYDEAVLHLAAADGRRIDLVARAYDAGFAFRFLLPAGGPGGFVGGEETRFAFPADYACTGLNLGRFENSHEGEFDDVAASHIHAHSLYDAPLVCRTGTATFALAESDIEGFPGAYFSGRADGGLGVETRLTPAPGAAEPAIATGAAAVRTPWRVVMLADRPERLIESTLIDDLATPARFAADAEWIKPGKASWDWWSGPMVPKPGFDTATYRRFIDLAAALHLPYTLIDEGWAKGAGGGGRVRPDSDITQTAPGIDMPGLVAYARARGVGLWLWANWKAMDRQMAEALPLYARWGIKGIKVDFMDRQDQGIVDFYHKLLGAAAAQHLMVDLHGAFAPRGLERTYPNFMTQEGVMGAEYNKWTRRITAHHNVSLAYTRGLLGPMDYTPGGFRNVTPAAFEPRVVGPEVMTTRAQQLALYVVYLSPFACLSDAPSAYLDSAGKPFPGVDFLMKVPTSWDETRGIAGAFGHYVAVARRSGKAWYVGAITDETARRISIPTDFLGGGRWTVRQWSDGATPEALGVTTTTITAGTPIPAALAGSGGTALIFEPAS
ncbi:glycoside hydrolase family 97 protein [Sphingomonas morindae]|uniref:Glycoside hydrolase family 97 protein n=1 Tax=Sphingomonas morindae TaxID=1541170 RepID=A0ABY4XDM2_9SPHN|nr:glycoside hydrolase family 97 protein [Sphingomonas morindae]USI75030.1 glycoside hydrolase family 97 protein [Sphingomonas morindae]